MERVVGKSLIISYIWKNLFDNKLINKFLIIVPNLNLITQFKDDMIDYGIDSDFIGEVWSGVKEWDKPIVISTWQSLSNYRDKLQEFDAFMVDECHGIKAAVLLDILKETSNATYRFGCTGTMPNDPLEDLNVRSYLGPIFNEYPAKYLKEQGYLAPCQINQIFLHYKKKFKGDFFEVKDLIFKNQFRMIIIKNLILSVDSNIILLLVNKVEDEGQMFLDYLKSFPEFNDREIIFLSGKTKKDEREHWRQEAIKNDRKIIIISTYPIFQAGVNIPALDNIFFLSPVKSKIRLLQSIGRALRLHDRKEKAIIWDLIDDQNKWFEEHSIIRERYYSIEAFDITTQDFYEKDYENEEFFK